MGSAGNDILECNWDANVLYGMAGNDTLHGTWSDEYLYGGLGDDVIAGSGGDDYIDGGEGNDTISYEWSYKAGQVKGGLGIDVLDGSKANIALKIDLNKQYKDFEIIVGSSLNDSLSGNLADNVLYGGSGDDTLDGGRGSDTIYGGNGQDRIRYDVQDNSLNIHGGNDVDTLDASNEKKVGRVLDLALYADIENIVGGAKNDTIYGSDRDNYLSGGLGADLVDGGAGDDTLEGGGLSGDTLSGGTGNDVLIYDARDTKENVQGGAGSDTLSAQAFASSVTLDLRKYGEIENAAGGSKNDILQGSDDDNILAGNGGNDRLIGNDGADVLYGGDGVDSLYGSVGNDTLIGDAGSDVLDGGDGNDVVFYDLADKAPNVKGGAGYDILDAGLQLKQVKIDLTKNYRDFEVVIGSLGDDSIRAGSTSVELYGEDGNDALFGGSGNDTLDGGEDSDTLSGGDGQDVYVFATGSGDDIIAKDIRNKDDILRIGEEAGMFTFQQNGNDMELDLASGDSLLIQGWYDGDDYKIKNIYFGNSDQPYAVNVGTDGNDTVISTNDSEQLYGLAGNDWFVASGGNDIYNFNSGDGNDTIDLTTGHVGDQAKIHFGTGIDAAKLQVENQGNDLLVHMSPTDSLTLKGWTSSAGQTIANIQFADGGLYYTSGNVGSDGFITGDLRDNFIVGSEGNEFIAALEGNDLVYGGGGNDTLYGGTGLDILLGGDGDDVICLEDINASNGGAIRLVDGGAGRDMVTAWRFGSNLGVVTIDISDETKFINIEDIAGSTHDGDRLIGNSQANSMYGKLSSDMLSSGVDYFDGRDGSDTIFGYDGNDTIVYDSADSASNIYGGSGNDILDGSGCKTAMNVTMVGYYHNDEDRIEEAIGSSFDDRIQGTMLGDIIDGGCGDDVIDGGAGNDALIGSDGNDSLFGGAGDDMLSGGSGNDSLFGEAGNDTLFGGEGSDMYYWGQKGILSGNDVIAANDTITSDNANAYDAITFGTGMHPANLSIELKGTDLVFTAQNGETLTLSGWSTGYEPAITQFYFQSENAWYSIDPVTLLWTIDNAAYASGTATGNEDLSIHYGNDNDGILSGNEVDEMFYGGRGNEQIIGGGGDDILDGGGGRNTLSGGVGHDNYYFKLDGGSDIVVDQVDAQDDEIVFANGILPSDVEFIRQGNDLVIVHMNGVDTMQMINFYTMTQPINTFKIGAVSYNMYANDMQASPAGSTNNSNSLVGNLDNNIIMGLGGSDYLFGLDGSDILYGDDGNDYLYGYNGADYIFGGNGNDLIAHYSDVPDKIVDGGSGIDTIFGANVMDLSDADQYINIEDIVGTGDADTLTGSVDNNGIWGYIGADVLDGSTGNDSIWGGNIELPEETNNDQMSNDAIVDDRFIYDRLATGEYTCGDGGADILDASKETIGVHIDLSDSTKYNSMENVIGGSGDDYIYGGNETYHTMYWDGVIGNQPAFIQTTQNWVHKLEGGSGSDTLDAGAGNDDFRRINFLELNYGSDPKYPHYDYGKLAYDLQYIDDSADYTGNDWHGNEVMHTADTLVGGTGRDFYVFGHNYGNDIIAGDKDNCQDVIWLANDVVIEQGQDLNSVLRISFTGAKNKDMVISLLGDQAGSHLTIADSNYTYDRMIWQYSALVDQGGGILKRQYYALAPGLPHGFEFHSVE